MGVIIKSFFTKPVISVLFFLLAITIQSCGNENMVTQPNESNNSSTPLAKVMVTQVSSEDTTITLPKSGKTFMLPRNLSNEQIQELDKYISTHKTSLVPNSSVQPNQAMCGWHTTYAWEFEYVYTTATNKYLGIWTNILNPQQCFNYGFNQYFINGNLDQIETMINNAHNSGFEYNNLMVDLGSDYNVAISGISSIYNNNIKIGYYYIDEPWEVESYSIEQFNNLSSFISSKDPNCKLVTSSYSYPITGLPLVQYYHILLNNSNSRIMCDEYYGNCLGHTYDYWNAFYYSYYPSNFSNWMHVVINNGNGYSSSCDYAATSWQTLMSTAGNLGINDLWLYAYDTGDENAIRNFCYSAWTSGWLLRRAKQIAFVWQCEEPNPCVNCIWGSTDTSQWRVVSWYYTNIEQYFEY